MSKKEELRELTIEDLASVRCGGGADDMGSKGKAKAKVRGDEGEEYENSKARSKATGSSAESPASCPPFRSPCNISFRCRAFGHGPVALARPCPHSPQRPSARPPISPESCPFGNFWTTPV